MRYEASLHFSGRYIAHPYWPECERLIKIQKESGLKRVRSQEKATQVLNDYLAAHKMTLEDYERLEKAAQRPFYTLDGTSEIVISDHQMYGCLAQAASLASSSVRIARIEQLRSVITVSDFRTGKTEADGVWERFVVVKLGTGTKASNQRALRSNPYIEAFDATGIISFSPDVLDTDKLRHFLEFAGREIGVGASRKLGCGRFELAGWQAA